jgi:hypothetical protein
VPVGEFVGFEGNEFSERDRGLAGIENIDAAHKTMGFVVLELGLSECFGVQMIPPDLPIPYS